MTSTRLQDSVKRRAISPSWSGRTQPLLDVQPWIAAARTHSRATWWCANIGRQGTWLGRAMLFSARMCRHRFKSKRRNRQPRLRRHRQRRVVVAQLLLVQPRLFRSSPVLIIWQFQLVPRVAYGHWVMRRQQISSKQSREVDGHLALRLLLWSLQVRLDDIWRIAHLGLRFQFIGGRCCR